MTKVLVIGAGMAGCSSAQLLAERGWDITLIETAPFLGGGNKTFYYGGHPYTFGPRHFLTKDEKIFDYLNKFTPLRRIPEHEFLTYIERDPGFYHFPIHRDDIDLMPDKEKILAELDKRSGFESAKNLEEYWLASVGPTLYSKFVDSYSKKMWAVESNTVFDDFGWSPKGVALKTGPKAAWTEAISAFPYAQNGYDDYFDAATQNVKVMLGTKIEAFDMEKLRVKIHGEWATYDMIISTISPEVILNNAFGPLRWIGRDFFKIVLPVKEVFPKDIYFIYYANEEPFTRAVDYKKFYRNESESTLIGLEIPSMRNKLYPYPIGESKAIAQKYFDAIPKNVYSIGRAGSYEYRIDIAGAIKQSMELVQRI
jgi:UDP-galactopyranose mutase